MTSDDHMNDMADFDAELELLLGGGSPSAEAPAWFGDVAVLVRTARSPARPDELAGEADIVARMVGLRLAVLAEAAADAPADAAGVSTGDGEGDDADAAPAPAAPRVDGHVNGVNGRVNGRVNGVNGTAPPARAGAADGTGSESGAKASSKEPGGPTAREPMEERLRERMSLAELDEYRAKHGGERYYVAKHSAPAAEEPPHAVARTVGRVIAMKAVAITTAAALGVAAAAAATTGIVANVVVPAFNEHFQRPVPTSESPDRQKDDEDGSGSGGSSGSRSPSVSIVTCDQTVLSPCVPSPLNSVVTDPVTGATLVAPSTTALDSTSTSVPADTTTSTTSSTTSTSEPDPSTTVTPTTVPVDPQSLSP